MAIENNTQWHFDFFATPITATATSYRIPNTDGLTSLVITGTGFTYDSNGLPTGGAITSVSLVVDDGGAALVTMTDLHVTLSDYGNLLRAITSVDTAVTWDIGDGSPGTISSTLIRINNQDGTFTDMHGTGLSVTGDIFGGTVTSITHVAANGTTVIENVTGLSAALNSVVAALFGEADGQMMILLNTGDNTITSPNGPIEVNGINYVGHFEDGPGNDTYNGQLNGVSYLEMEHETGAVVANLATGVATVGGDTNTLINILGLGGTDFNDQITGSAANNGLSGWDGNDTLSGANGDDVLNGGLGNDTIDGGSGNDTASYFVEFGDSGETGVTVSLAITTAQNTGGSGSDTLISIENIIGTDFNDTLTGNSGVNVLAGMGGNDTLNGGAGADVMSGGAGNDTYTVDNVGDLVNEDDGAGTDTVKSSINYALGANVENLTLTSSAAFGTGNALANTITGNAVANTLNGGDGADILIGGAGADRLIGGGSSVDTASYANAAAGVTADLSNAANNTGDAAGDTYSSIEVLIGSNFDDTLTGSSAANRLNGGAGADHMNGGNGNDTYIVDNAGDVVSETVVAGGVDTVQSYITYQLGANLENLSLIGSAAINGTGNTLANTITGNAAANTLNGGAGDDTLNGGAGADHLNGGAGNDAYVVDNVGDVVTEALNGGTDLVQSSVTYTLSANIESLFLTGAAAINGTGNSDANTIIGNSAANTLNGGAGNDTLVGGGGHDLLNGASGNDAFIFYGFAAADSDTIGDFSAPNDQIYLDNSDFTALGPDGALASTAFWSSSTGVAHDADDRIIYNSTTGQLFYDADGNGAGAAMLIATLTAHPTIDATNFFII